MENSNKPSPSKAPMLGFLILLGVGSGIVAWFALIFYVCWRVFH